MAQKLKLKFRGVSFGGVRAPKHFEDKNGLVAQQGGTAGWRSRVAQEGGAAVIAQQGGAASVAYSLTGFVDSLSFLRAIWDWNRLHPFVVHCVDHSSWVYGLIYDFCKLLLLAMLNSEWLYL